MMAMLLLALVAPVEPDGPKKVDVKPFGPFFESNRSGLKGDSSHLVFTSAAKLNEVLRLVPPIGGRRAVPLPEDAFTNSLVLVVIRRGMTPFEYAELEAKAKGDTLTFSYKASPQGAPGSANFASPVVVTVPKGKYKKIEFVENGKKAASVKVE